MRPLDPRLLREAPAARRFLAAATVLALLDAGAIVAQAVALGRVVDHVFLHHAPLAGSRADVITLVVATVVRATVAWTLESGGRYTALTVAATLRAKLVRHLLTARPGGVHEVPAGALGAAAVTGLDALDPYFARFLPQLVLSIVVPAVIFAWVVMHDLTSALVMLFTLPLIPIFGILIGKVTQERTLRRFGALSLLSAYFLDVVRGLPTLRAFGRGGAQGATISSVSDTYRRETMGTLRIAFLSAFVLELAATLSTAMIAVEIGVRLVDGGIALAPALAILVLAPEYYGPLRQAAAQFHASADGLAAARRVFELLDLKPALTVPAEPLAAPDLRRATLVLDGVTLRGPRVDAAIPPGARIVLAGPSGSGKTSLLAVLLRLEDAAAGRVLVDGVDLALVDAAAWRTQVAWLPQRPQLEPGTLRDALCAGRGLSDEALLRAMHDAGAPLLALDAVLDERVTLSAGELRRLALARALAGGEPLLVLDEPTTHLDAGSADVVVRALAALPLDRTLIVATHDQRVCALADTVIELGSPLLEAVA